MDAHSLGKSFEQGFKILIIICSIGGILVGGAIVGLLVLMLVL